MLHLDDDARDVNGAQDAGDANTRLVGLIIDAYKRIEAAKSQCNRLTLDDALSIGAAANKLESRGLKVPELSRRCQIPRSTLCLYCLLAKNIGLIEAARKIDPDLSIHQARRLITKPRAPTSAEPLMTETAVTTTVETDTEWTVARLQAVFAPLSYQIFREAAPAHWIERLRVELRAEILAEMRIPPRTKKPSLFVVETKETTH